MFSRQKRVSNIKLITFSIYDSPFGSYLCYLVGFIHTHIHLHTHTNMCDHYTNEQCFDQ